MGISSAIIQGEDGASAVIASGGGGFEFGVDPNEDPELALALRISMEENRARHAREEATSGSVPAGPDAQTAESGGVSAAPAPEDEAMLARALEMSMETGETKGSAAPPSAAAEPNLAAMTEEEQIEYAMRMSMQDSEATNVEGTETQEEKMEVDDPSKEGSSKPKATDDAGEEDYSEVMNDPEFLQSVLESLPGVDPQSDAMRQAMGALTGSAKKDEPKDEKKNDDKDKK